MNPESTTKTNKNILTKPIRVLYSFPHKIGADRICYSAWNQVDGIAAAGADVMVMPGVLYRPFSRDVRIAPTLSRGKLRISYKMVGMVRACAWHDYIVSRRLEKLAYKVDIVHAWALGSLRTLKTAARLGIPTVLERANAHTRYAYEAVQRECDRLGVVLPRNHEHAYNPAILKREEAEYQEAYRILCPSDFVIKTFVEQGISRDKLIRHFRGVDQNKFSPSKVEENGRQGITMLFVGVCAVRKGLHFALEAWLKSPAHQTGTFLIAGEFLPAYQRKLAPMLAHHSVKVLGHRNDVPDLMRKSDIVILPSIEEGFGRVCTEAMGSGCVPLVSEACTDICKHMENSLVHKVGDIETIEKHITMLYEDRELLKTLRSASLRTIPGITWSAAGERLVQIYKEVIVDWRRAQSEYRAS